MASLMAHLDRRFYPGVSSNWDDAMLRDRVASQPRPLVRVLDLGAGAGIVRQMDLRGIATSIHGADLDPRIASNPYLHYGCRADARRLPYRSGSFDVVVADNVLEHLGVPAPVFAEIHRVLRPGGLFHFKTPNRFHYVPAVARLTPHWFHRVVTRARGRGGNDTFETHYRANSRRAITRLAQAAGFTVEALILVEGRPEYCRIHPLLYACGIAYERLVNRIPALATFRVVLLGSLRKGDAV